MKRSLLRRVATPVLRGVVERRLRNVEGLRHLPADGAFVLVANHTSYLDHFILIFVTEAVRDGELWFLTKRESFATPLGRRWARAWNGIPVDRGHLRPSTMRAVNDRLAAGDPVCIYPEGTRGADSQGVGPFKAGAFHFAVTNGLPVIPVAIAGADIVLPKGRRRPRQERIDVRVGAPLQGTEGLSKRQRIDQLGEQAHAWLSSSLADMWAARRPLRDQPGSAR